MTITLIKKIFKSIKAQQVPPISYTKKLILLMSGIMNYLIMRNIDITIFQLLKESAVDLLEELDTPAYKIASFEITDIPLIEYVASKQKPILLSTGMANMKRFQAIKCIKNQGNHRILLFHLLVIIRRLCNLNLVT